MSQKVKHRSALRLYLGKKAYSLLRRAHWLKHHKKYARRIEKEPLAEEIISHSSPLIRKLKNVDMVYQYNKVENLKIAIKTMNGLVLKPGEIFSFWKLVGKTTRRKGYKTGFTLDQGKVKPGIGGGLCQLSNLIYWMSLHTPLTVIERHRHSYDVFPDVDRKLPFGCGATVSYNYVDLQIKNTTSHLFQLALGTDEINLLGQWRSDYPIDTNYQVVERDHSIQHEVSGVYSRKNRLYRETWSKESEKLIDSELIAENHALMMYNPLLEDPSKK